MNQELVEQISKIAEDATTNKMHTALPCKIVKYDAKKGLCDIQPIGNTYINGKEMKYPVIPAVPLVTPSNVAAGISVCSPIKKGDTVLYQCTEQSISKFLTNTDTHQQDEKFELQNGFVTLGAQRKPIKEQQESNKDGALIYQVGKIRVKIMKSKVEIGRKGSLITVDSNGKVSIKTEGNVEVNAEKVNLDGEVHVHGDVYVDGTVHPGGCDLV